MLQFPRHCLENLGARWNRHMSQRPIAVNPYLHRQMSFDVDFFPIHSSDRVNDSKF